MVFCIVYTAQNDIAVKDCQNFVSYIRGGEWVCSYCLCSSGGDNANFWAIHVFTVKKWDGTHNLG